MGDCGGNCNGGCDRDAPCCTLCGLAAIRRELARLGPPTNVKAVVFNGQNDWELDASCASSRFTHLYVGTAGNVYLRGDTGDFVLKNLAAGMWHPVPFARAIGASTTATDLVVGWVSQ